MSLEKIVFLSETSRIFNPKELINFVYKLKRLSNNKPVGIKLCVGHPWEFISIVKTMVTMKKYVDFITIDGSEGGTEQLQQFTDHFGSPLTCTVFASNALIGAGLKDRIKLAASGKLVSAFDKYVLFEQINMARPLCLLVASKRACHTRMSNWGCYNDKSRYRAIDIEDRSNRASNFHKNTLHVFKEMLNLLGLSTLRVE